MYGYLYRQISCQQIPTTINFGLIIINNGLIPRQQLTRTLTHAHDTLKSCGKRHEETLKTPASVVYESELVHRHSHTHTAMLLQEEEEENSLYWDTNSLRNPESTGSEVLFFLANESEAEPVWTLRSVTLQFLAL